MSDEQPKLTSAQEAAQRASRRALVLSIFVPPYTLVASLLAFRACRREGVPTGEKEAIAAFVNSAIGTTLLVGLIIAIPLLVRFVRAQLLF